MDGSAAAEAVGAGVEGGIEHGLAFGDHLLGAAGVDGLWGEHRDPRMPMVGVVGVEEPGAELACGLDRGEMVGEGRAVLQGLELRFGVRIVESSRLW